MRSVWFSMLLLVCFFVIELLALYHYPGYGNGSWVRLGVLVFILIQAQIALHHAMQILRLSRMAQVDALTCCQNRTAYIQRLIELDGHRNVGVILADLDNLKLINDTRGHNIGDDALVRSSSCFTRVLSSMGGCYRIGGDEFVFLGCDLSPAILNLLCAKLEAEGGVEQSQVDYPFHFSCGYAVYNEKSDNTLTDTVRRADRMMYRNKRISKGADKHHELL